MTNINNKGTLKLGSILLIIVALSLIVLFFFENYFTNSKRYMRYITLGIMIAGILILSLYFKLFYEESAKINNMIGDENKNIPDLIFRTEDHFKKFFKEDLYYLKFKNTAIEIGLIDNNCKWLFQKKEILYFALLINKLKNNNYLESTIENKDLCEVSNKLFDIKIDSSMLSKYDPNNKKNNNIKEYHLEYYENVYNVFNLI